jgi:hypothetical protein
MPDLFNSTDTLHLHDRLLDTLRRLELLEREFHRVAKAAPTKPREGEIVFADGSGWNPGSGRGLYQYVSGAWVPMFASPSSSPATWTTLTPQNSWTVQSYDEPLQCSKNADGWVAFYGNLTGGNAAVGTLITTLPVGMRPAKTLRVPAVGKIALYGGVESPGISIANTGAVQVGVIADNTRLCFSTVFKAA